MSDLENYVCMICLANSWKHQDRCLAGINPENGQWMRVVTNTEGGKVPLQDCLINGKSPEVLDILRLPLADNGPDYGFASENRLILPGQWYYEGKATPKDIVPYCSKATVVLHNQIKYVDPKYLQNLSQNCRITLQLVETVSFILTMEERKQGGDLVRVTLVTKHGGVLKNASVTDPAFVRKVKAGYQAPAKLMAVVGLSMPWKPDDWEEHETPKCWKLIAGVIEFDKE